MQFAGSDLGSGFPKGHATHDLMYCMRAMCRLMLLGTGKLLGYYMSVGTDAMPYQLRTHTR